MSCYRHIWCIQRCSWRMNFWYLLSLLPSVPCIYQSMKEMPAAEAFLAQGTMEALTTHVRNRSSISFPFPVFTDIPLPWIRVSFHLQTQRGWWPVAPFSCFITLTLGVCFPLSCKGPLWLHWSRKFSYWKVILSVTLIPTATVIPTCRVSWHIHRFQKFKMSTSLEGSWFCLPQYSISLSPMPRLKPPKQRTECVICNIWVENTFLNIVFMTYRGCKTLFLVDLLR